MLATFILVLFYRYDRVTTSLWIRYPEILLGEGLQLTSIRLQIILWLRNGNSCRDDVGHGTMSLSSHAGDDVAEAMVPPWPQQPWRDVDAHANMTPGLICI
jgi:hypothetical protein